MNIKLPEFTGIEWGIIAAICIILVLLAFNGEAMNRAHCRATGQQRFLYLQNIGGSYMPIYSHEYICDGGEVRWN
jgi:hypothetical protein